MVYQAVAEYWSKTQNVKEFNLEVDVQVASWAKQDKWIINRRNQFVTRTTKVRPAPIYTHTHTQRYKHKHRYNHVHTNTPTYTHTHFA